MKSKAKGISEMSAENAVYWEGYHDGYNDTVHQDMMSNTHYAAGARAGRADR